MLITLFNSYSHQLKMWFLMFFFPLSQSSFYRLLWAWGPEPHRVSFYCLSKSRSARSSCDKKHEMSFIVLTEEAWSGRFSSIFVALCLCFSGLWQSLWIELIKEAGPTFVAHTKVNGARKTRRLNGERERERERGRNRICLACLH